MIAQIELQMLPNQKLSVLLGELECDIQLRQMGSRLYLSLAVDNVEVFRNAICTNAGPINGATVLEFPGVLFFLDTKGKESPQWEGLNDRWKLFYASNDEPIYKEIWDGWTVHA